MTKKKSNHMDRVQLIESPQNGVLVRINLIEKAKENIDISYYTFRNGKVAKMMLGSILDAANRGVKIRILLDSLSFLPSFACEKLKLEYREIKDGIKYKLEKIKGYDNTIAVENISFVHNSVGKFNHEPRCLKKILYLSSKAKESIFIQSPYIIPSKRVKTDFMQYDIDLGKVTILTNSYYSSPNYLSISAYICIRYTNILRTNKI